MMDESTAARRGRRGKRKCCKSKEEIGAWLRGPSFAIYFNYVLSAWGDWMWQFAAGLYLVFLADGLRLAAIFGLTAGTLMLLFGGIIGDWVDRNGRLKVVGISLFIQNSSVALCATTVCLVLRYHSRIYGVENSPLRPLVEAIIIILALIAVLSSMAYKIAIEKDWIVVIASGNRGQLTNLNAVTRAIDLSCKILAPTVAGIIMSYSHIIAAICIAVWNVVSVFCEYAILWRVYKLVPALAVKGSRNEAADRGEEMKEIRDTESEKQPMNTDFKSAPNGDVIDDYPEPEKEKLSNGDTTKDQDESVRDVDKSQKKEAKSFWQLMAEPFLTLAKGWRTYARQKVVFAGMSLACLYMTVLGFDYVTTGYIYRNGVKESYVGISMAAAGVTGIIGTFVFSRVNKRLGLERTGLIAFTAEILCLLLTVASIWAPGSLFNPTFSATNNCSLVQDPLHNLTLADTALSLEDESHQLTEESRQRRGIVFSEVNNLYGGDYENRVWMYDMANAHLSNSLLPSFNAKFHRSKRAVGDSQKLNKSIDGNMVGGESTRPGEFLKNSPPDGAALKVHSPSGTDNETVICETPERATLSIILFLVGIVASRIGLWMADLVVTQLLQENVQEMERGIVNGVQNSLNMLMDMIKNALVIALPMIETFGILILLSFCFICIAGGMFCYHVWRVDRAVLTCGNKKVKRRGHIISEIQVKANDGEMV